MKRLEWAIFSGRYTLSLVSFCTMYQMFPKKCLVMQLYDCSLWDYLKRNDENTLNIFDRICIARNVMIKYKDIIRSNMAHRDVKPSNVLINENTREICITDFGISAEYGQEVRPAGTSGWACSNRYTIGACVTEIDCYYRLLLTRATNKDIHT